MLQLIVVTVFAFNGNSGMIGYVIKFKIMTSNIEKYKKDLKNLIQTGENMLSKASLDPLEYEPWYSESLILLKQVLPDRVSDFERCYQVIKNYSFMIDKYDEPLIKIQQQVGIIKSAQQRFESSLFDIKQTLQADLFDNELDAATELNKNGFHRGAGAIAGVVLEGHLGQVCQNHNITIQKQKPTINDLNQALYNNSVKIIDLKEFQRIQLLGNIRNNCDHSTPVKPTKEDVEDLIEGTKKIIKNVP